MIFHHNYCADALRNSEAYNNKPKTSVASFWHECLASTARGESIPSALGPITCQARAVHGPITCTHDTDRQPNRPIIII